MQVATPFEGISNKRKQIFQQDPLETNKIVYEKIALAKTEIDKEIKTQLESAEGLTISDLVSVEVTIEATV